MIPLADIEAAAKRLSGRVLRTPTVPSDAVSTATGAEVVLKLDNLQVTGAFKERGAANRLALLTEDERAREFGGSDPMFQESELPSGDELIEEDLLDGAVGVDGGLEAGQEFVELVAIFGGDDEVGGGEAVFAGVLGGSGQAGGGAGAGAEGGVGRVGGLAGF